MNAAAIAARTGIAADAAQQRQEGRHQQPDVHQQAREPLLGGDRDRDRVRRAHRLLGRRAPLGVAVGPRERARPVALQRLVAEQVDAALEQVVAPAGRRVGALGRVQVQPDRRRRGHDEDRADDQRGDADAYGPARRPARAGQDQQPQQQRGEARLRQRQHEPRHQHREHERDRPDVARPRRPDQHRRQPDHHDRQEAPVDVGVEEQRVDAEVRLELVGGDDLRVQEQVARRVLDEADAREGQRQHATARPSTCTVSLRDHVIRASRANSSANGT